VPTARAAGGSYKVRFCGVSGARVRVYSVSQFFRRRVDVGECRRTEYRRTRVLLDPIVLLIPEVEVVHKAQL
jgi:hypothetical protein